MRDASSRRRGGRRFSRWLLAVALAGTVGVRGSAQAQSAQGTQGGEANSQPAHTPPGLLSNLDGIDRALHVNGVDLQVRYISEVAHNLSGGTSHRATETGQLDFTLKADLEKAIGLRGGSMEGVISWRRGKLLDDLAGIDPLQQTQEIYGRGQTWRLTSLWYEQKVGRVSIKVGRANVGEDFATFPCDFMNLTFCTAQPGNIVGDYWFNAPVSQWATRIKATGKAGFVQIGFYEVNPRNLDRGIFLGRSSGQTGVLIPAELVWKPTRRGLSGTVRVGGWNDTSHADDAVLDQNHAIADLTQAPALRRNGRWGGWVVAQQHLTGREDSTGKQTGLSVFGRAALADRRTAFLTNQITAGIILEGLPPFGDDALSLAIGRTHVNGRVAAAQRIEPDETPQGNEYVGEAFYSLHPVAGIVLRPDLQLVVHPGGRARPTALVLGLKSSVTL